MFLPALEEKLKRDKEQQPNKESRLHLPDLQEQYEEYIKNKQEEKPTETVITIQIF